MVWEDQDVILLFCLPLLEDCDLLNQALPMLVVERAESGEARVISLPQLIELLRPVDVLHIPIARQLCRLLPICVQQVLEQEDVGRLLLRQAEAVLFDTETVSLTRQPISFELVLMCLMQERLGQTINRHHSHSTEVYMPTDPGDNYPEMLRILIRIFELHRHLV